MSINPAQSRMARAALELGVGDLAELARVPPEAVASFEAGGSLEPSMLGAVQSALEAAGVVFLAEGERTHGGAGVRLRNDAADGYIEPEDLSAENDGGISR